MSELRPPRIEASITAQSLLQDNHSPKSVQLRKKWGEYKDQEFLTAIHSCSDARLSMVTAFGTPGIISLRSIAAADIRPNDDPFRWVYNHPSTGRIIVAEHFDGENLQNGQIPSGCGGLVEKKKVDRKTVKLQDIKTAADYVLDRITHDDIVVQAVASAARIAAQTRKPVLAGAIDHRTHQFYQFGEFSGNIFQSSIKLADILDYNPESIYRNGIPNMDMRGIPGVFTSLLDGNEDQVRLLARDPEFFNKQKIQDPRTVIISTDIRPTEIRYPNHFGKPNTAFNVRIPLDKEGGLKITNKALSGSIAQVTYALGHAADAFPGQSFASTKNVLVETPDKGLTREIAAEILHNAVIQDWQAKKQGQILIGQVNSNGNGPGETTSIENY